MTNESAGAVLLEQKCSALRDLVIEHVSDSHAITLPGMEIKLPHFITAHGVHLRLVAPLSRRVKWMMKKLNLSKEEAARAIRNQDRDRKKMILTYFQKDIDDPKNYDDASIEIAELVATGQFELYFCSTDCLRAFLNYCVDELERRRKSHRHRKVRHPKGKSRKQEAKSR